MLHPGTTRMLATISQHYKWPSYTTDIKNYVSKCSHCQNTKITGQKQYGHLPLISQSKYLPFQKVHVDNIGPWNIKVTTNHRRVSKTIKALTIVDRATNWIEFQACENLDSITAERLFDNEWLCRYPRPNAVTFDNGREFIGTSARLLFVITLVDPSSNCAIPFVSVPFYRSDSMVFRRMECWSQSVESLILSDTSL